MSGFVDSLTRTRALSPARHGQREKPQSCRCIPYSILLQFIHDISLNISHQAKLSGRRNSRRSVVSFWDNDEMQLTAKLLSAVEQDREAKSPRLLPGEKGHVGYV
jgi:hypothetical protein